MAFKLDDNIQYVQGVGPKRAKLLNKLGIKNIEDILFYFPRNYINKITDKKISELKINEITSIKAKIISFGKIGNRFQKAKFQAIISDGSGYLKCIWFNASPWLEKQFEIGKEIIILGTLKYYYNSLCMLHPDIEFADEKKESFWAKQNFLPIYPLTEGLSNKIFQKIILNIFNKGFVVSETLPKYILEKQKYLEIEEALKKIHMPNSREDISVSKKRFIFEELFYLQIMLARRNIYWHKATGNQMKLKKTLTTQLKNRLSFELTTAQKKVLNEIVDDMKSPFQMNRLLQGDVGSGKTIISIFAMLLAIENGFQAAIMAPTEILATQHYFAIKEFLSEIDVKIGLLLGGNYAGKKKLKQDILDGKIDVVIGTHSLIQKDVNFQNLGIIIIDEQHRFGVIQRQSLSQKGQTPDKIFMSATPIPRSLALTIYGDLDVSVIDELPPNRQKIYTSWISANKKPKVFEFVNKQISEGRQVYLVCPLVEETEKSNLLDATSTYERLKNGIFQKHKLALLHGRMSNQEKDEIMHQFKNGKIDILVSTTVIEVGIDVPNATIMIIEHSERFGLSQLHQLRGRVGRGAHKSYCVLVAYEPISEEALLRLNTMKETNDGFQISEVDLEIRGPGEFFGTDQSGIPKFRIANIVRDRKILEQSRKLAFEVISEDYDLNLEKHKFLKKKYKKDFLRKEKLFSF
ncbi:MAG: ATP-dependent DNA helicase RecG [Candidatus Cloacimonetes bacterium]|nr:ATP-dependent DNA helicase RecG [Candidatus Cloacimonadota bacterium]MBL7108431.1 ATP-dependent DNA helicase RecG [Candidatus Cloacimonadota bacterium]